VYGGSDVIDFGDHKAVESKKFSRRVELRRAKSSHTLYHIPLVTIHIVY